MSSQLLPLNSTQMERALADAMSRDLPAPLRELMDPERCPGPLLPYLAWACSVDRWDMTWPEPVKRKAIAASFRIHQRKGTVAALRRVIEPLGYLLEVVEWWQLKPQGVPGTFALVVGVLNAGISDEMYAELIWLIDDAKPLSRHLVGLNISLEVHGRVPGSVAHYDGDILTVYPYTPETIEVVGMLSLPGREHFIDTVSVYPWQ